MIYIDEKGDNYTIIKYISHNMDEIICIVDN